jgi:predicted nucleic acid-binding protein
VTFILDSGAISALAADREQLVAFRARWTESAQVPAIVLVEALTGDHRRDYHANQLLQLCEIHEVDDSLARKAARLRTLTRRAGTISAADAVVAAFAAGQNDPIVLTSDPKDLLALAEGSPLPMKIHAV